MTFKSQHTIKLVNAAETGFMEIHVFDREVSEKDPVILASIDLVSLNSIFQGPSGTAVLLSAMEWGDLVNYRETGELPIDYLAL